MYGNSKQRGRGPRGREGRREGHCRIQVPDHLSSRQSALNSLCIEFSRPLHTAYLSMSWPKPDISPIVLRIESKLKVAYGEGFTPRRVCLPIFFLSLASFFLQQLSQIP